MDMRKFLTTALMVPLNREQDVPLEDPNHLYGVPVCFAADPGTGKSEITEQLCEELKFLTHVVFIPSQTAEDLGGYAVMINGKFQRMTDDQIIHELAEIGEGVVLLDEINTNSQNIYRALLSVLLKRRYGGIQLKGRVRFIAARNPVESSAGGIEFPAPIANRFLHCDWTPPSVDAWCDWVSGVEPEDQYAIEPAARLEKRLIDNWSGNWASTVSTAIGFMRAKRDSIHKLPEIGSAEFSGAWPSRRTWWWGLRSMTTAKALSMGEEIRMAMLRGCIGEGMTKEFFKYEKALDLPSGEDMIKKGFTPDKMRIDRSMAAFNNLGMYVTSLKKGRSQVEAATVAWDILNQGCGSGLGDIVSRPARMLVSAGLGLSLSDGEPQNKKCIKAAEPVLMHLQPRNKKALEVQKALEGV